MRTFFTVALALLLLPATISLPAAAQASTSPQAQTSPTQGAPSNQAQAKEAPTNDELQLTEEQEQKIAAIMDDEDKQIATVRDSSLTEAQKTQKVQEIRRVTAPKVRAVLTPEQLQKITTFQDRRQREQNGQTPPPQPQR